jgi:hypothetical protein
MRVRGKAILPCGDNGGNGEATWLVGDVPDIGGAAGRRGGYTPAARRHHFLNACVDVLDTPIVIFSECLR